MTIKSRVQKLEQRNGKLAVLTFNAFCADTRDGLTEASKRARYFAGSLSTEFVRAPGKTLMTSRTESLRKAPRPSAKSIQMRSLSMPV